MYFSTLYDVATTIFRIKIKKEKDYVMITSILNIFYYLVERRIIINWSNFYHFGMSLEDKIGTSFLDNVLNYVNFMRIYVLFSKGPIDLRDLISKSEFLRYDFWGLYCFKDLPFRFSLIPIWNYFISVYISYIAFGLLYCCKLVTTYMLANCCRLLYVSNASVEAFLLFCERVKAKYSPEMISILDCYHVAWFLSFSLKNLSLSFNSRNSENKCN